jgi:hypothetical protein
VVTANLMIYARGLHLANLRFTYFIENITYVL